jgi:hypothetical protein
MIITVESSYIYSKCGDIYEPSEFKLIFLPTTNPRIFFLIGQYFCCFIALNLSEIQTFNIENCGIAVFIYLAVASVSPKSFNEKLT